MKCAVTVDASVFVNAFSSTEKGSDDSLAFLDKLRKSKTPLIQPTLFFPEVVAAIARKQDDTDVALQLAEELKNFPSLTLIDLDESLADLAGEMAAKHRLRGCDAVYAAVAFRFGTQLVSLDKEQLERVGKILSAKAPY